MSFPINHRGLFGRSWWTFFKDLWTEIDNDRAFMGAAALAFYSMLAIFPSAIFLLSLLPYLPIADLQGELLKLLQQLMPGSAVKLFDQTIQEVVGQKRGGLLSFGILFTLWASSSGVHSAMEQLNVTYGVTDSRGYLRMRAVALGLTFAFSGLLILSFILIVLGGWTEAWIAANYNLGEPFMQMLSATRWIVILVGLFSAFAALYFFGPDVKQDFRFISPGSVIGVSLLICATLAFKYYVEQFGDYNATYGGIGAFIVLMLWFYIMGTVVLLGSEINALIEHYSPKGKNKGEREKRGSRIARLTKALRSLKTSR